MQRNVGWTVSAAELVGFSFNQQADLAAAPAQPKSWPAERCQ